MKFARIDAEKAQWPIEAQCAVLGVSRSGYYAWKGRPEAARAKTDAELVVEIKAAYRVGREAYGSPRVHRELRANGRRIGKKRIERLMRREGIVAHHRFKRLELRANLPFRRRHTRVDHTSHAVSIPPSTVTPATHCVNGLFLREP